MKHSISVVLAVLLAVGLWRCTEQPPENSAPRDVQFTVRTTTANPKSGRVDATDLPPGTQLLLSIQKSTGEAVLTHERIDLLKLGDSYVSSPITLLPGNYSVVDFMLVLDDSVLYATPHAGSPLAAHVANPLPYGFTVSADALLTLDAEVLPTDGTTPAQFGYVAFDIDTNTGDQIVIAVFAADGNGLRLIDGEAFILSGRDTLVHIALEPTNNELPFSSSLDPMATYRLVVLRHGFKRFTRNFVYKDLQEELDGHPLKVTLVPALTFVTYGAFNFYTRTDVGTGPRHNNAFGWVYTDFGDNVGVPGWPIGAFQDNSFDHEYAAGGGYFISVTGALDLIQDLFPASNIDSIDVSALTRLKRLNLSRDPRIRAVDLTENDSLESLEFPNAISFTRASISLRSPIREVRIQNTAFTSASISDLIDEVYTAAVYRDTHNGVFDYTNVAAPSPDALSKLQYLQGRLNWTITPSPF